MVMGHRRRDRRPRPVAPPVMLSTYVVLYLMGPSDPPMVGVAGVYSSHELATAGKERLLTTYPHLRTQIQGPAPCNEDMFISVAGTIQPVDDQG